MAKHYALIATAAVAASIMAIPSVSLAQDARYYGYNSDTQCQQQVNNGTTAGGLVGAGLGAVAGRSLASRGNRNEGAVLGAVVGAVIGSQVGKNRHACDDKYQYDRNRQQGAYGYPSSTYGNQSYGTYGQSGSGQYGNSQYSNGGYAPSQYGNDDYYDDRGSSRHHNSSYNGYNNRYSNYSAPIQYSRQSNCGWGTAAYQLPNGRVVQDQVYMCRQRNGEWTVTNR